ncbi:FAD dependent oxidoreductase-1 [Coleophoma crateriformis]|uniref:FAD dependent oxidoreductase-1 n=1 Tax=Coleophoma crateriformis TaxID=565419 RepID=A0A3D8SM48_9HELO|nr:FAD dependent oxidoreductase-1 [Coleophoma crateriformis]
MASYIAEEKKNIVIIGGGIIGCTTAYFLTRHPSFSPTKHSITILEATSIASGASGKAGGLLALWAYPSCIVPLSYKLHAELAAEHNGEKRWGYRAVHCGSLSANGKVHTQRVVGQGDMSGNKEEWQKLPKTNAKRKPVVGLPQDLDWFDGDSVTSYSKMGDPTTTAQVHPYEFTTSMADLASEAGAKVILGSVTSIDQADSGVKSVTYTAKDTQESHTLPASDVILSAGPWTSHIFPAAPIEAMRAHSVTIKAEVSPYAIFSEIDLPSNFTGSGKVKRRHGRTVSPEMYARPHGEVYACGEGDTLVPLPKSSDLVECDESRCQDIIDYVGSISTPLREGEVLVKQACYLPSVSVGGGPLIGQTGIKGLLMATGHTCWGIQNSCATGKLMSEFVFDGKAKSANIGSLDPRKVL